MKNKYFTPDIEEMFVGCEFEMHDTWGNWKKLILTEELLKNPLIGLGSGNERVPWYWKIRVPYLTKDDNATNKSYLKKYYDTFGDLTFESIIKYSARVMSWGTNGISENKGYDKQVLSMYFDVFREFLDRLDK